MTPQIVTVKSKFDIFTKDDLPKGEFIVLHDEGGFQTSKDKIEKARQLIKEFENDKIKSK